jgi:hypothetical protein
MKRRTLVLGALAVAALALSGAVWWLSAQESLDRGTDDTPTATSSASEEVAIQSAADAALIAPAPPSVSRAEGNTSAATRPVADQPFFPIRSDIEAGEYLRRAHPLERILTPSSIEDQLWMQKWQYPRLEDIDRADWRALEAEYQGLQADGRPPGQTRHSYVANVLAASKYRAGDPGWAEWANRSLSPFARALELSAALEAFRADPRGTNGLTGQSNQETLNRAISRAFFWGERAHAMSLGAAASMSSSFFQGRERFTPIVAMQGLADLERLNAQARRQGQPPLQFDPRPSPPWSSWGYQERPRQPGPGG